MKIGIIGGGQLGMMMAVAAHELNHQVIGLDPNPKCPLSTVTENIIIAEYDDKEAFKLLVNKVDVITYEFENVSLDLINKYIDIIPQRSKALEISKDRLLEKNFANKIDIPTVKFKKYSSKHSIFFPSIIKTTTGGYDGKGQSKILNNEDVDRFANNENKTYIIEELFDYDYEISVIATRSTNGDIVTFPIPTNIHQNGILFMSKLDEDLDNEVKKKAIAYTETLLSALDYVGTLAVEFFVKDNEVLFNEFAPRPHNSGHYTIEGCNVSQFTNHIKAIINEKLIKPELLNPTFMINVLGQDKMYIHNMDKTHCTLHDYQKDKNILNRKMAHITCVHPNKTKLNKILKNIIGE